MRTTDPIARASAFLGAIFLLSSPAFADETEALYAPASLPFHTSLATAAILDELDNSSPSRLSEPVDLIALADLHLHPLNELHFQESDLVSRLSKLRGLSMLTMAEMGPARLFFGVNDKGLVGLHFNTGASDPGDIHVEVLRMPYLDAASDPAVTPDD